MPKDFQGSSCKPCPQRFMSRSASTKLCTDLFVWMPRDPLYVLWMTMKNTCTFIFIIFLHCKTLKRKSQKWNFIEDFGNWNCLFTYSVGMVTDVLGISSEFQWKLCHVFHPDKEGEEKTSSSYGVFNIYSPLSKREGNWGRNASRNCFWDHYWGHAGQLLANFFFVLGNSPRSLWES